MLINAWPRFNDGDKQHFFLKWFDPRERGLAGTFSKPQNMSRVSASSDLIIECKLKDN